MVDHAPRLKELVFNALVKRGQHGAIADELERELGMLNQTITPRLRELWLDKRIFDSGIERKTKSGRWATVYVANRDWAKRTNGFSPKEWARIIRANGIRDDQDRQS